MVMLSIILMVSFDFYADICKNAKPVDLGICDIGNWSGVKYWVVRDVSYMVVWMSF